MIGDYVSVPRGGYSQEDFSPVKVKAKQLELMQATGLSAEAVRDMLLKFRKPDQMQKLIQVAFKGEMPPPPAPEEGSVEFWQQPAKPTFFKDTREPATVTGWVSPFASHQPLGARNIANCFVDWRWYRRPGLIVPGWRLVSHRL
jgi:hypothetical protein